MRERAAPVDEAKRYGQLQGVSNRIVYDPLLVRHLARELDDWLRDRAVAAAPSYAPDLAVTLAAEGGEALRIDLHPTRGWVRRIATGAGALDARCLGVEAPADERILIVRLLESDRFGAAPRRLVLELHTNQWNALLVSEQDDRILSVLRARDAGERVLRPGAVYVSPPPPARLGARPLDREAALQGWRGLLQDVAPGDRRGLALRSFAYLGSINVDAVLGDAAEAAGREAVDAAFERWWRLRSLKRSDPVVLLRNGSRIPYPTALPGVDAEPVASVLDGMAIAASDEADAAAPLSTGPVVTFARGRMEALQRRIARLQAELTSAESGDRLREQGALLLSRLGEVERGVAEVGLAGWDGSEVRLRLDPALSPRENAEQMFEEARRRDRAAARVPELVAEATRELRRWTEALRAAESGKPPTWAAAAAAKAGGESASGGAAEAAALPYRSYRTSGGLEVRVGRSAAGNDRLTFGHSRPNDVWLHARSVAGSHVVLRWAHAEGAPPARDLGEAATLAAVHSKARGSSLVAIDWTRRKYVRKPRGAPPGRVVIQRAKTLFVEPDPALEERLRAD